MPLRNIRMVPNSLLVQILGGSCRVLHLSSRLTAADAARPVRWYIVLTSRWHHNLDTGLPEWFFLVRDKLTNVEGIICSPTPHWNRVNLLSCHNILTSWYVPAVLRHEKLTTGFPSLPFSSEPHQWPPPTMAYQILRTYSWGILIAFSHFFMLLILGSVEVIST